MSRFKWHFTGEFLILSNRKPFHQLQNERNCNICSAKMSENNHSISKSNEKRRRKVASRRILKNKKNQDGVLNRPPAITRKIQDVKLALYTESITVKEFSGPISMRLANSMHKNCQSFSKSGHVRLQNN